MLRRTSATNVIAERCSRQAIKWKPVKTNIYTMIPFTWIRCLFFLGSITLYATDVVRSGLGIKHVTSFGNHRVGLDTFSSFGPFAYPVQTIVKNNSHDTNGTKYFGFAENESGGFRNDVPQVDIWPYKSDTLSVGLRGLAMELDVKEYPHCTLISSSRCTFEYLSLEQVFSMLDGVVDGIQARLAQNSQDRMVFMVQHQWVDTFEQTMFAYFRREVSNRFFTLHSFRRKGDQAGAPLELVDICRRWQHHYDQPMFCSIASWLASLPLDLDLPSNTTSLVSIDEHIALRFARLQAEHPDLEMEMIVLTATHQQFILSSLAVYYTREGNDIVTLIRGRRCDSKNRRRCETMLIDDYRYERSVFDTNVEEMYGYAAFLRGSAQLYVWLRLCMLVIGIVTSTWYESKSEQFSLLKVLLLSWVNLLKVPSHVVVYGTMAPIVLHALAHLTDCYVYHLIVQDTLGTLMGKDALLDVRTDLRYVTLKMRNVWFIALLCILIVWYRTHPKTWRHYMGIVGFRGAMISFLAFTSLLFPVRFPSLRQIDLLSFTWNDVNWTIDVAMPLLRRDFSSDTTGPLLEIRCFLLAVIALMAVLLLTRMVSRMTTLTFPAVMAYSSVIPYSAGTLWSTIALTGFWITNIDRYPKHVSRPSVTPTCQDEDNQTQPLPQVLVKKMPSHIHALRVERRTEEIWALIRLMNIVMMTDPWVYARLRFIGVDLFLYRSRGESELSKPVWTSDPPDHQQAFLLPERMERLYDMNQLGLDDKFELVGIVNSRNVSWNKLIMCG